MAKQVITSRYVSIGTADISSALSGATLEIQQDSTDKTSLGSGGWRELAAGLKSGTVTLNFMQDFGVGGVDSLLYPLIGTEATVVMRASSATVSATNPAYTATVLIDGSYSPIAGAVGDLATFDVSWSTTGAISRATA
jgi:hypothetical protein